MADNSNSKVSGVFGILGCISAIIFFLTPAIIVVRFFKLETLPKRSERLSPLVVTIITYCNCMLWFAGTFTDGQLDYPYYAYINLIGSVLNSIWMILFLFFLLKDHILVLVLISIAILGVTGVFIALILIEAPSQSSFTIQIIAALFNIGMYLRPGLNIVKVFRTRNAFFIPTASCYVGTVNCIAWLLYACLVSKKPWPLIVTNVVGIILCVVQVILSCVFVTITDEGRRSLAWNENQQMIEEKRKESKKKLKEEKENLIETRMNPSKRLDEIADEV